MFPFLLTLFASTSIVGHLTLTLVEAWLQSVVICTVEPVLNQKNEKLKKWGVHDRSIWTFNRELLFILS